MSYEALTQAECQQDEPVTTDLLLKIKNNFDYIYSLIGSGGDGGGGGGDIPNGSLEIDEDADNIPDTWTRYLYPGGSGSYDIATPMHGAKSYRFTRAAGVNNGGGYLECSYVETNELSREIIRVIYRCSVAGIKVMVQVRYYDKDKVEIGSPTTLFSSTANPTTGTQMFLEYVPVANARYLKVRLIGGYTDTDVAGDVFFDGVKRIGWESAQKYSGTIAEESTVADSWTDCGSFNIVLPNLNNAPVHIFFRASARGYQISTAGQRFRVGTNYSNYVENIGTSFEENSFYLYIARCNGGTLTVYQQLKSNDGGNAVYGKKDVAEVGVIVCA
jgi:hypothetical protein